MLAYLEGEVKAKGANFVILATASGMGYLVYVPPRLTSRRKLSLFVYQYQTEKTSALFGFSSFRERELFASLIKIPGLGPKGALGLLSLYRPAQLLRFIEQGDIAKLEAAPGIGKKTARKLLAEFSSEVFFKESDEKVIEALQSLGFSRREAQDSLRYLTGKEKSLEQKIRRILKEKGKNVG